MVGYGQVMFATNPRSKSAVRANLSVKLVVESPT
jgi:hypothetical protein